MQKKKSIIAYGSLKELHAKMSLFFYAVLLRGRMQKYIFTCGPLKWLVCENTLLFSFQHFRFFFTTSPLSSSFLLMSLPLLSPSLSFSPLLFSPSRSGRRHRRQGGREQRRPAWIRWPSISLPPTLLPSLSSDGGL